MSIFSNPEFDNHEGVYSFADPSCLMRCFIAVHSTKMGPASGGTRFWTYVSDEEALTDALRLSKAMSYKNALAGIPLGGGKGVIMKPGENFKRKDLFTAYGKAIDKVGGRYITAEDVGVSPEDMQTIKEETHYVAGLEEGIAASGDPSPHTADGVLRGMEEAVKHKIGVEGLGGITVAIQGLGHVGYDLARRLHNEGAHLIVADINKYLTRKAKEEFNATIVSIDQIHAQEADIFSPCALGGSINSDTLPDIQAYIIAGAANNQLFDNSIGTKLLKQGILYCPDYVINAGGIINVASEISGHYDLSWVDGKIDKIRSNLKEVFDQSARSRTPTNEVADSMARAMLCE